MAPPDGRIQYREVSEEIIGAFYRVYNGFGYGLLETPYALALELELMTAGLKVERQVRVPLYWAGRELMQYRLDMLVEGCVVLEIKAGERLHPAAKRQLYNYLKATSLEVGLLLHFGPEPQFERVFCSNRRKPLTLGPAAPPSSPSADGSAASG